jgi:hypothetical protein
MSRWVVLAVLAVAPRAAAAPAPEEKPGPAEGVSIELSLSVTEFDPYTPSKGVVRCVLHNNGKQAVQAPAAYDGRTVVLHGGQVDLRPRKPLGKDDVKTVAVEPGKDQVLFELSLDDILKGNRRDGDWSWDWPRRPEPPLSPIHKYRQVGYVDEAGFQAQLTVGTERITSNTVVLKVKPSQQPNKPEGDGGR